MQSILAFTSLLALASAAPQSSGDRRSPVEGVQFAAYPDYNCPDEIAIGSVASDYNGSCYSFGTTLHSVSINLTRTDVQQVLTLYEDYHCETLVATFTNPHEARCDAIDADHFGALKYETGPLPF